MQCTCLGFVANLLVLSLCSLSVWGFSCGACRAELIKRNACVCPLLLHILRADPPHALLLPLCLLFKLPLTLTCPNAMRACVSYVSTAKLS